MALAAQRRLFTRHDVYAMIDAGILREDERTQLINGEIVHMTPSSPSHSATIIDLAERFRTHLTVHNVVVREEKDFWLADGAQLYLPDIAVVRPFNHHARHAEPGDTHLVVEVAHTSLRADLETKLPLYLREGVPEVWVVDLGAKRTRVYKAQGEGLELPFGEAFAPAAFPEEKHVWLP